MDYRGFEDMFIYVGMYVQKRHMNLGALYVVHSKSGTDTVNIREVGETKVEEVRYRDVYPFWLQSGDVLVDSGEELEVLRLDYDMQLLEYRVVIRGTFERGFIYLVSLQFQECNL